MTDCIFCKIIKNEIPCDKIYEDKDVIAFLDIKPINKYHTLVIPKKHYVNITDVPENELAKVIKVVKKLSIAILKLCDGVNISQSNKKHAGQVVDHIHFHIMPRFKDDGFKLWGGKEISSNERKENVEKIKSYLK